jgi:hypothetical protein
MQDLAPQLLAGIVGAALSLGFSYIPKFNAWYAGLAEDVKKSVMAVALIVSGVVLYVLACVPSLGFPFVSCPTGGIWSLLTIILSALVANQGVFRITPKAPAVKAINDAAQQ